MQASHHQQPVSAADQSGAAVAAMKALSRKGASASQDNQSRPVQIHYPFWFGGSASSMAACVTHPLDLGMSMTPQVLMRTREAENCRTVKVRLQTRAGDMPKSMSGTFVHIVKHDGLRGLYSGLSASLLRQITYSTTRFGIYEELKSRFAPATDSRDGTKRKPPSFTLLVAMASTSGFIGGFAGNPADVLNVRMQHDASLPPSQRRNYAHAVDGLVRMAREEGVVSWFRGVGPNAMRAAAMTASQLASYDVFKRTLIQKTPMEDNMGTHFTASFLAGIVAATVTSPIDVVKTRIMTAQGTSGLFKLLGDIYAAEGLRWMFKGWVPSFLRLGP